MEQPPQPASVPHWALNLTQLLGQYMDIYNIYTIYMEHPPEIQASVKKHSPTFLFKSIFLADVLSFTAAAENDEGGQ